MNGDQTISEGFHSFPSVGATDEEELITQRIALLEDRLSIMGKYVQSGRKRPKRGFSGQPPLIEHPTQPSDAASDPENTLPPPYPNRSS